MRTKTVTLNDKSIIIRELRVKDLRSKVIPLLSDVVTDAMENMAATEVDAIFGKILDVLPQILPEITPEDLEEAYMSELEALLEAFVEVNFSGLKKLVKQFMQSQTQAPS